MTKLLEQAIGRLQDVSEDRQDQLAGLLLHELQEDELWIASTQAREQKLGNLVEDILASDDRGEYETLDPEKL